MAMTASFGPTRTASFGPTWGRGDALNWAHLGLPRSLIVADAPRRSRSYVLASLRALHLDLRLVCRRSGSSRGKPLSRTPTRVSSGVGPFQADIEGVRFEVGPLQAVRVGPVGGVLTILTRTGHLVLVKLALLTAWVPSPAVSPPTTRLNICLSDVAVISGLALAGEDLQPRPRRRSTARGR